MCKNLIELSKVNENLNTMRIINGQKIKEPIELNKIKNILEISLNNKNQNNETNFNNLNDFFEKEKFFISSEIESLLIMLNKIKGITKQNEYKDAYDLVIEGDSFYKPWNIIHRNKDSFKKNQPIVTIIGNFDKGKSFILSELSGKEFPSGFDKTTPWICGFSFKNTKEYNFLDALILDSAGFETPLVFSLNEEVNIINYISYIIL